MTDRPVQQLLVYTPSEKAQGYLRGFIPKLEEAGWENVGYEPATFSHVFQRGLEPKQVPTCVLQHFSYKLRPV